MVRRFNLLARCEAGGADFASHKEVTDFPVRESVPEGFLAKLVDVCPEEDFRRNNRAFCLDWRLVGSIAVRRVEAAEN